VNTVIDRGSEREKFLYLTMASFAEISVGIHASQIKG
jgi:hypothetical protein